MCRPYVSKLKIASSTVIADTYPKTLLNLLKVKIIAKKRDFLTRGRNVDKKGRNNGKWGAIRGAIKTLRPSLKALVSLTLTLKGAQCFKI